MNKYKLRKIIVNLVDDYGEDIIDIYRNIKMDLLDELVDNDVENIDEYDTIETDKYILQQIVDFISNY